MSRNNDPNTGVPRWTAPWAAGWTAMSDVSRIEIDRARFENDVQQRWSASSGTRSLRRMRAVGLTTGAIAAALFVSAIVRFWPNG